jgi:GH24 family phage-related lysozyme (muramidase)
LEELLNLDNFMAWTANWEGRRNKTYIDTMGHPTVGIGFNLDAQSAQAAIESLGLDYNAVRSGAQLLTDDQIDALFAQSLNQAIGDARTIIQNFDALSPDRQVVVADMIFNLGLDGFSKFKQAIHAINSQDWPTAAQQMQQSSWFNQVGDRARANCEVMAGTCAAQLPWPRTAVAGS